MHVENMRKAGKNIKQKHDGIHSDLKSSLYNIS